MQRLALPLTTFITVAVTAFLVSMLWVSLHSVGTAGMADQPAPTAYPAKAQAADETDEGPSAAELDAAFSSARRTFPASQSGLIMPVEGIAASQIVDTFGAGRGGGRSHGALDIMAPRGRQVVSAAEGVVERLHLSSAGGITAYVRSTDGAWVYYYAHLDSYAPGLAAGQHLRQGDPIGRVGSTGNANAAWPHLHFAVYRMAPGARFYQGQAVNPYPLLAGNAHPR
jgi:murein DD-endopeptidase MepM/ murein hydrolase activator NlpD